MTSTILVTGGAGFAGAHICEHILRNTDAEVIVLDRISYAGSLQRLSGLREEFNDRIRVVNHDFSAQYPEDVLYSLRKVKYIIHNGGETHVERSLVNAEPFVKANVLGTMWTLEAARQLGVDHYIQISTDEVHGPAPSGVDFKEDAPIRPSNPYSASKAAGEALAFSYWRSHGLPVTITRTMNLFGERQHKEKFIPMVISKVLSGEKVTVHGTSSGKVGSRKWLHARNQADALLFLLLNHAPNGETFHIAGKEKTNLEIAQVISHSLGKGLAYSIVDFHAQRPGHDLRYSLDDSKLRALGWKPPVEFEDSLRRTVEWTTREENRMWLGEDASMAVTV